MGGTHFLVLAETLMYHCSKASVVYYIIKVQCSAVQPTYYSAVQPTVLPHRPLSSGEWVGASFGLTSSALHCILLYCILLYMLLHCTALHYIVLHCYTSLHYSEPWRLLVNDGAVGWKGWWRGGGRGWDQTEIGGKGEQKWWQWEGKVRKKEKWTLQYQNKWDNLRQGATNNLLCE